jgi:hypothetical protein
MKTVIFAVVVTLLVPAHNAQSAPSPKPGKACKRAGIVEISGGKSYTCVKVGKKTVWSKGVVTKTISVGATLPSPSPTATPSLSPTPSPTPAPTVFATPSVTVTPTAMPTPTPTATPTIVQAVAPKGFDDLYENRKGISYAAWNSVRLAIESSETKSTSIKIFLGPKSTPHDDSYEMAIDLLARALPKTAFPSRTLAILFKYQDIDWAEKTLRENLSAEDYRRFNEWDSEFIRGNCSRGKLCFAARQGTTFIDGVSVIAHGLDQNPSDINRHVPGMLEVHEYYHGIQRLPILNKNVEWPPAWFREGSATWMEHALVLHKDFDGYLSRIRLRCDGDCRNLSESDINEYLSLAKGESVPAKFSPWLSYSLGLLVSECLAAVGGQQSLIGMYEEVSTGISFDAAFKKLYGTEWKVAIPILAKTIYATKNDL